jgi:hypothetical protein
VTAPGATWLDYRLVERERMPPAMSGFGQEVRNAMEARAEHLAADGLARRQGPSIVPQRDLLATLRRRELDAARSRRVARPGLVGQPGDQLARFDQRPTLGVVELSQVIERCRNGRMAVTEHLFFDRQRSLVERLGIDVATLGIVETGQVIERCCNIRMAGTERLLPNRQRSLVEPLGVRVAALLVVEQSQIVERQRNVRMIGTKRLLINRQL